MKKLPFANGNRVGVAPSVYVDDSTFSQVGAYFCKTITLEPRKALRPDYLHQLEKGFINQVGLENLGLQGFIKQELPHYRGYGVPVIVSLFSGLLDELIDMVAVLDCTQVGLTKDTVSGYELNLFCPNMPSEAWPPELIFQTIRMLKKLTSKPIGLKLPADLHRAVSAGRAADAAGIDWLTVCNTQPGLVKVDTGFFHGGVSGPTLKPVAMRIINELTKDWVNAAIVASGGIGSLQDVLDYQALGADYFLVCSEELRKPGTAARIGKELLLSEAVQKESR